MVTRVGQLQLGPVSFAASGVPTASGYGTDIIQLGQGQQPWWIDRDWQGGANLRHILSPGAYRVSASGFNVGHVRLQINPIGPGAINRQSSPGMHIMETFYWGGAIHVYVHVDSPLPDARVSLAIERIG